MAINIEPVSMRGLRVMALLYGLPQSGKTLSALRLAAGLEPDPAKRGLLDTEGGERGRVYQHDIEGGYLYGALKRPFTPERYIQAIREFEAAGCNVLVIDSISHAWYADGGVLDMVDDSKIRNDFAKWKEPKRRLGKMMGTILQNDMNIILCARGKVTYDEVPDPEKPGKTKRVPGDTMPIFEKMAPFDMLVIAHMLGQGRFNVAPVPGKPIAGKCPGSLRAVFEQSKVMTEETGAAIREWIGQIAVMTPEQRNLMDMAEAEAGAGRDATKEWWAKLTDEHKAFLGPHKRHFWSMASAADADRERQRQADADREAAEGLALSDGIINIPDNAEADKALDQDMPST